MTVYTNVAIYDQQGSHHCEVYSASCVRVHWTGYLYCLNQEIKLLYKKKQIPNERIYRAHVEFVSQWQGMCLCVE
jgi:outer membrane protein assembly factor BamB